MTKYNIEINGYEFLSKSDFLEQQITINNSDWLDFCKSWDNMPVDPYMADGGNYRRRRFGQFILDLKKNKLDWHGNHAFFQGIEYNSLNGGVDRHFESLMPDVIKSKILEKLITYFGNKKILIQNSALWMVNIHQIRVECDKKMPGNPTPEGIHQDGHHYVAQILIQRNEVKGGESIVYVSPENSLERITLSQPLDAIFIDDKKLWHSVTSITPCADKVMGFRDMLLLDFNPL